MTPSTSGARIEARARCGQQDLQIQAERARERRLKAGHRAVRAAASTHAACPGSGGIAPST